MRAHAYNFSTQEVETSLYKHKHTPTPKPHHHQQKTFPDKTGSSAAKTIMYRSILFKYRTHLNVRTTLKPLQSTNVHPTLGSKFQAGRGTTMQRTQTGKELKPEFCSYA